MLRAIFKIYFWVFMLCLTMAYCTPAHAATFKHEFGCLAKNIYHEAGRESMRGKLAVGQVTLNRVRHPGYPRTVCGVVHQTNSRVCQFSWVCQNHRQIDYKSTAWRESTQAAYRIMMHQSRVIGNNVLFFHATAINPMWNYQKVAIIGGHVFYKKAKT